MADFFQQVSVVLVEPQGPLNIGSAARAMMNTGFKDLVVVRPAPFRNEEGYKMAVSAREILDQAQVKENLDEALAGCNAAFGVTARSRHRRPRLTPREAAKEIQQLMDQNQKVALVFGREDFGLSSDDLDRCNHLVGIPSHSDLNSFNLAQAVLLICHTLFMEVSPGLEEVSSPILATHEDRERIEEQTLDLLKTFSYLTPNRELIVQDMAKRLVYRADLETRDVRNVLAILRHIRYCVDHPEAMKKAWPEEPE
jgi:tRNA/rRNA methyltransferase